MATSREFVNMDGTEYYVVMNLLNAAKPRTGLDWPLTNVICFLVGAAAGT